MTPEPATASAVAGVSSRLAPLDGMRGLAVLGVLAYHYTVRWTPPLSSENLYPYGGAFLSWPLLHYAWAGVELFFVVSGYVILMTLERCQGIWDFARRRMARLWPAMLACALITTVVAHFGPQQWKTGPEGFVLSILFIDPGFVGGLTHQAGLRWVDGVYWTLWIEVRFYVMAALIYALSPRRFLTVLSAVMLVSFLAGLRGAAYPGRPWAWVLLLPTFLPYFVFGAAAFRLSRDGRLRLGTGLALAASACVVLAQGWLSFEYPDGGPQGFFWINLVILGGFVLFARGSPLAQVLAWRPLARLGEASYSLYLLHSVVGVVLIGLLSKVAPWPAALAGVTVAMVGAALALHRWIEVPGKALVLRLTRPAPSARSPSRPNPRPTAPRPSTIANG